MQFIKRLDKNEFSKPTNSKIKYETTIIIEMKVVILFLIYFLLNNHLFAADSIVVNSPDKKIQVTVRYKAKLSYTIKFLEQIILQPSYIDITLNNGKSLSDDQGVLKRSIQYFNEKIISPVPEKRKEIADNYNLLTLQFKQPYTLLFRVYNDGVAYRLVTRFKDSIFIKNEVELFAFNPGKKIFLPIIESSKDADHFHTSFEELYKLKPIDSLTDPTGASAFISGRREIWRT